MLKKYNQFLILGINTIFSEWLFMLVQNYYFNLGAWLIFFSHSLFRYTKLKYIKFS